MGKAAWQTARDAASQTGDAAGQAYDYGRRVVRSAGVPVDSPWVPLAVGAALGFGIAYLLYANQSDGRARRGRHASNRAP
jgi:ElaB/YqjD/DUF883 family membrane-anchored ribosome-binding protein